MGIHIRNHKPDFSSISGHLYHGWNHKMPPVTTPVVERRLATPKPSSRGGGSEHRTPAVSIAAPASATAKSLLAGPTARRTKLDSEHIQSAGFKNGNLFIRFTSGPEIYVYSDVPEKLYNNFLAAKSHGKFFRQHIRDVFPFTKRAK